MGVRVKGLDLSEWNDGIRMEDVLRAGYKYVILRAGFTGYGNGTSLKKDYCFEKFYSEAKRVGLGVGAYWYSCATDTAKGEREAKFMLEECLKGKQFEYPIYIDVEDEHWQAKTKQGTTNAIKGFCSYLEDKGYFVGVYASYNWFKNYIIEAEIKRYSHWLAYWTSKKPSVGFKYAMWQNSSTGYVGNCKVDTNVAYEDFPSIIKNAGLNGYGVKPEPKPEPAPEPEPELKLGNKVKIIGTGNGSSYGTRNTAYGIGFYRYIIGIWKDRPFPYQVGSISGTTGFYKKEALEKVG